MAKMTNETLGHAEDADGIEEYDNPLPDWWVGMFILSIAFAAVYPIWFHSGNTQLEQYEREMAAANERWPQNDALAELPTDAATIAEGAEIFTSTCASCHKADMTGGIGPNLVDAEWIHGGTGQDILKTVTEGVSSKGMPAWGAILGPKKVQAVSAFVLSKQVLKPVPAAVATPAPPVENAPEGEGTAAGDAAALDGEKLFATNCVACHLADLTGQVGPNLVDSEWIHGGSLEEIQATITNGVPEKGMIAWGPILGEAKIEALARYVHSKGQDVAE